MVIDSISFRGHRCFKSEWCGFDTIKPINVIIGRNNTGKSHLLDLARALCERKAPRKDWTYKCSGTLDENSLLQGFPRHRNGGLLHGDHWDDHGHLFSGVKATWELTDRETVSQITFPDGFISKSRFGSESTKERLTILGAVLKQATHSFNGSVFRRLLADRDIRTEVENLTLTLGEDGAGATNIIRRYINTSNAQFPRELIQVDLLAALNQIFGQDGQFTEIQVKHHDEASPGSIMGHWEVFLGEAKKGLVALSNSGSGLKTVILVLLNLLVIPRIDHKQRSNYIFAFEELENNLHPALLRRLFQYVEDYAVRESAQIFLTTHSSTALDVFGISQHAQIIHVTHDGETARAQTISAHFDHLGVISELGAKPSDLLQANGIIWVEGPSDCIYLNRWIDLFTNNELKEGRDYQCAFYGGSLISRVQFTSPADAEKELVNLFRVNPNIVVICDGDRSAKGARVKDRVRRIRSEVLRISRAHIWVTQPREIENYLPGEVLSRVFELNSVPSPEQYDLFFPRSRHPNESYLESKLNRKSFDKMELAIMSARYMTKDIMQTRFDWTAQMEAIVDKIRSWNK